MEDDSKMARRTSLEDFPAEIIISIASSLSCRSALNLMLASKRLHKIVYDPLVFAAMLKNQFSNTCFARKPSWISHLDSPDLFSGAALVEKYPRFLLADERITHFGDDEAIQSLRNDHDLEGNMYPSLSSLRFTWRDYNSYALQLLALHHPAIDSKSFLSWAIYLLRRLPSHNEPEASRVELYVLDTILALLVLQHGMPALVSQPTLPEDQKHLIDNRMLEIKETLVMDALGGLKTHYAGHGPFFSLFICTLYTYFRGQNFPAPLTPPFIHIPPICPPSALDIPMASLMDLPLPFTSWETGAGSELTGSDVMTCHLKKMCDPDWFFGREWMAYYTLSLDIESTTPGLHTMFQPPVVDIQFSFASTTPSSRGSTRYHPHHRPDPALNPDIDEHTPSTAPCQLKNWTCLSATGSDHGGRFTAGGHLNPTDGSLVMHEINWRHMEWTWHLKMTPFGLFGTWGPRNTPSERNGYMWMYPMEWSYTPPISGHAGTAALNPVR